MRGAKTNKTTLREFVTEIDRTIVGMFEDTGVVYPVYIVETASGERRIVPSPSCDKDTAAILMRVYFAMQDVTRFCFADEAWQAYIPVEDMAKLPEINRAGLANHPGRIECVMYSAEDVNEPSFTAHRVITRPPGGKPKLGPLEFFQSNYSEGRFVGMLPQRGVTQ